MVDDTETPEAMAKELADRAPRGTVRPLLASLAGEHNLDRIRHHVERGAEQTGRDLRSIRRSYNVMGATDPAAAPPRMAEPLVGGRSFG